MNERMTLAEAKEAFDAVSKPITPPQWIKCSERQPPIGEAVIVYCADTKEVLEATRDNAYSGSTSSIPFAWSSVTHWQPLPEPPKEGE